MEILINELSLNGQFASVDKFALNALPDFISLLKEINPDKDSLYKKYDFYACLVTPNISLHSILTGQESRMYDEIRKSKSLLHKNLFENPFWEEKQKHDTNDMYEFGNNNVAGSSLAESCERDKIVISFIHDVFSNTVLQITKNEQHKIQIDNLFSKRHYFEIAYTRGQLSECEYFERKFAAGCITLLENEYRFRKTNKPPQQGKPVYEEISTKRYWYLDNLHKTHYEVFDNTGKHI